MKEWRKENYVEQGEKYKDEAKAKIPEWIKKGEEFIYPERAKEWKRLVESRAGDLYYGEDLDAAIEIMEKLESGATLDEAKEILDNQNHSGASCGMVRNIIFAFSKQGPEFWEHTAYGEISSENKMAIADKKKENSVLAKLHDSKNITSDLLEAMSKAQTWLSLKDLQTVLPPEKYQELVAISKLEVEQFYKKHIPGITQEEIEQVVDGEMRDKEFEIGVDDKGEFMLQEFSLLPNKLTRPINESELDETKLANVVEKSMQKHLDYDRFYANKYLDAEQIPETLAFYIEVAKQCQARNREIGKEENETKKTQLEQKEDELTALKNEAKTISEAEVLIDKQQRKKDQGIGEK